MSVKRAKRPEAPPTTPEPFIDDCTASPGRRYPVSPRRCLFNSYRGGYRPSKTNCNWTSCCQSGVGVDTFTLPRHMKSQCRGLRETLCTTVWKGWYQQQSLPQTRVVLSVSVESTVFIQPISCLLGRNVLPHAARTEVGTAGSASSDGSRSG